mmetsp:Transcript_79730/g.258274  ORF Transcript_79730/g.258274 Transcript_79730/m.258274 type:complete len:221 (-) Transcript_79730:573-1235(-)
MERRGGCRITEHLRGVPSGQVERNSRRCIPEHLRGMHSRALPADLRCWQCFPLPDMCRGKFQRQGRRVFVRVLPPRLVGGQLWHDLMQDLQRWQLESPAWRHQGWHVYSVRAGVRFRRLRSVQPGCHKPRCCRSYSRRLGKAERVLRRRHRFCVRGAAGGADRLWPPGHLHFRRTRQRDHGVAKGQDGSKRSHCFCRSKFQCRRPELHSFGSRQQHRCPS